MLIKIVLIIIIMCHFNNCEKKNNEIYCVDGIIGKNNLRLLYKNWFLELDPLSLRAKWKVESAKVEEFN